MNAKGPIPTPIMFVHSTVLVLNPGETHAVTAR
jgi:hypothetical protein